MIRSKRYKGRYLFSDYSSFKLAAGRSGFLVGCLGVVWDENNSLVGMVESSKLAVTPFEKNSRFDVFCREFEA